MSEEIKDASITLPRAMMWTVVINGSLGFVMLVTFCFCLGDVETILSNPNVMPFVQTFLIATKSHAGTSVMTSILIILTTCGCITNVATASRQMFAFARDQGLPFSNFLAHVSFIDEYPIFSSLIRVLIFSPGSPRVGYPIERCYGIIYYHNHPLHDQHRFYRCIQRHCFSGNCSTHFLLHYLDFVRSHQKMARTQIASCKMESREVWSTNQRLLHSLPYPRLHILVLPYDRRC